jgi:hypothetical protein
MVMSHVSIKNEIDSELSQAKPPLSQAASSQAIEQIRRALEGLRFGTVSIIVQDGVVVQIERTEKTRLR